MVPKEKLEELLRLLNNSLRKSLDKENGLRFLLAGTEQIGHSGEGILREGAARYHTYNEPWDKLKMALEAAIAVSSIQEPYLTTSLAIIKDLKDLKRTIDEGALAVHQYPAIKGRVILD